VTLFTTTYCSKDHKLTVPSAAPDTIFADPGERPTVDFGWNATPPTLSVCPLSVKTFLQSGTEKIFTKPLHAPVANNLEEGENAQEETGRSSAIWEQ
jgi:hypothetical protein